MSFHKSEIYFLVFMVLVLGGAASSYMAMTTLTQAVAPIVNTPVWHSVQAAQGFLTVGIASLFAASLGGVIFIYPQIRGQARQSSELSQVARRLTEKSESYQHAALTDVLTGLQNRRYFDDALAEYLEEFGRIGRPIGVMVIDLDHFKAVNDTHGHDVGDEVLKRLGACLIEFTRFHDVAARLGGEEFAVVAPNLDAHALAKLADRIRIAISEMQIVCGNVHLKVTASIGLASWDGVEDGASLVKRADANLYHAKHNGRNRIAA